MLQFKQKPKTEVEPLYACPAHLWLCYEAACLVCLLGEGAACPPVDLWEAPEGPSVLGLVISLAGLGYLLLDLCTLPGE